MLSFLDNYKFLLFAALIFAFGFCVSITEKKHKEKEKQRCESLGGAYLRRENMCLKFKNGEAHIL